MKFIWALVATLSALITFALVAANKSGEALAVMPGHIQDCAQLGGDNTASLVHATIKTQSNNYLVAVFQNCRVGIKVNVITRRGALYFNTVYEAEQA